MSLQGPKGRGEEEGEGGEEEGGGVGERREEGERKGREKGRGGRGGRRGGDSCSLWASGPHLKFPPSPIILCNPHFSPSFNSRILPHCSALSSPRRLWGQGPGHLSPLAPARPNG